MRFQCRPLTEQQEAEQHPLYMAAGTLRPNSEPTNLGDLLYCPVHRRPLIECHDKRIATSAPDHG